MNATIEFVSVTAAELMYIPPPFFAVFPETVDPTIVSVPEVKIPPPTLAFAEFAEISEFVTDSAPALYIPPP